MFGLGLSELVVIGLLGLFFCGPSKLPEFARVLARLIVQFKRLVNDVRHNVADGFEKIGGEDLKNLRQFKMEVDRQIGSIDSGNLPQMLNRAADVLDKDSKLKNESKLALDHNLKRNNPASKDKPVNNNSADQEQQPAKGSS